MVIFTWTHGLFRSVWLRFISYGSCVGLSSLKMAQAFCRLNSDFGPFLRGQTQWKAWGLWPGPSSLLHPGFLFCHPGPVRLLGALVSFPASPPLGRCLGICRS